MRTIARMVKVFLAVLDNTMDECLQSRQLMALLRAHEETYAQHYSNVFGRSREPLVWFTLQYVPQRSNNDEVQGNNDEAQAS